MFTLSPTYTCESFTLHVNSGVSIPTVTSNEAVLPAYNSSSTNCAAICNVELSLGVYVTLITPSSVVIPVVSIG